MLAAPALTRSFLLQSASACTAKMGTLRVAVVVSLPACSGHVHRPASVATRVGTGSRVSGKGRGALTICYIRPGPDCVVLPCIDSRRSGLRQQQKLRRIRLRQQQKLQRIRCMLLFHVALSAFLMQRLCVVRFRLQRAPCLRMCDAHRLGHSRMRPRQRHSRLRGQSPPAPNILPKIPLKGLRKVPGT